MRRKVAIAGLLVGWVLVMGSVMWSMRAQASVLSQIPTGSIPTVTGSPIGAMIIVLQNEQGFANLRSGPGTLGYEIVGVLVVGQQAPALGRTAVGDWIEVSYPGVQGGVAWVFKDLVEVRGDVPIIEMPPTNTPRVTSTIDPTLAAQYLVDVPATRMPTYTPGPSIPVPTFPADVIQTTTGRVPIGFVIVGLAVIGLFGLLISFLRGR